MRPFTRLRSARRCWLQGGSFWTMLAMIGMLLGSSTRARLGTVIHDSSSTTSRRMRRCGSCGTVLPEKNFSRASFRRGRRQCRSYRRVRDGNDRRGQQCALHLVCRTHRRRMSHTHLQTIVYGRFNHEKVIQNKKSERRNLNPSQNDLIHRLSFQNKKSERRKLNPSQNDLIQMTFLKRFVENGK
jgi:hypothetical protein